MAIWGGFMNLMGRVAKLLLGSALDLLVFRRGFSACAPDGGMSRAPVCSLRALRVCLVAALLFSAFLPQLASAASPSPAAENPSVTELEQLVQTLKNDKGREAFVAQL